MTEKRKVEPRLLTADEAAIYLGTTKRHVDRMQQERRLAFVRVGGKIRFLVDDLEAFIDENRQPPVEEWRR